MIDVVLRLDVIHRLTVPTQQVATQLCLYSGYCAQLNNIPIGNGCVWTLCTVTVYWLRRRTLSITGKQRDSVLSDRPNQQFLRYALFMLWSNYVFGAIMGLSMGNKIRCRW